MADKTNFLFAPNTGEIEEIYRQGAGRLLSLPEYPGSQATAPRPSSRPAPTRDDVIRRATELGVDPSLALSIWSQESQQNWNSPNSPKGAVGGMQVMPGTYRQMMGTDEGQDDPWNNMEAGLRYLAYGKKVLGTDDPRLLAAGYHAGYGRKELKQGVIPNTHDGITSTSSYAAKVAGRVGLGGRDPKAVQAELDAIEPGRYRVLTPDEARRLRLQAELDAEEPGRYRVLTPGEVDTLPDSALDVEFPSLKKQEQTQEVGFFERIPQVARNGWNNMARSLDVSRAVLSDDFSPQTVDLLAESINEQIKQAQQDEKRQHASERELKKAIEEFGETEGWGDTTLGLFSLLGKAITNPRGVAIGTIEQLANMLPSMGGALAGAGTGAAVGAGVGSIIPGAGTAAGAATGALWGSRAGLAAGTAVLEFGNEITEAVTSRLEEQKKKPTKENIAALLSDPKVQDEIKTQAAKKGLTLAAVDALTMGIAGKIGAKGVEAAKAGRRGAAAGYGAGAFGVELVGEPAGEAASQFVARGEINKADVAAEGIFGAGAAVGGAAVGTAGQAIRDRVAGRRAPGEAPAAPEAAPGEPPAGGGTTTSVGPDGVMRVEMAHEDPAPQPTGPIGRAMEKATGAAPVQEAAQPEPAAAPAAEAADLPRVRIIAENGDTITGFAEQIGQDGSGRVIGDDGQVYQFTADDGVTIEPIEQQQAAAPAPAEQPAVAAGDEAIWQNADHDVPVEVVGIEPEPGSDGRTYARVKRDGQESFVPADELVKAPAKKAKKAAAKQELAQPAAQPVEQVTQPEEPVEQPALQPEGDEDAARIRDGRSEGGEVVVDQRGDQRAAGEGNEVPPAAQREDTGESAPGLREDLSSATADPDAKPALGQDLVVRNDGTPFKSEAAARQASKNRRLKGYEPVEVDGGWALRPTEQPTVEPTNSLARTASWIIRDKETGSVVMETYDRAKVEALNTERYEAVPAQQHLAEINDLNSKAGRAARQEPQAEGKPAAKPKKAKQPAMPRQDFDSTAGVGKISAVKERYSDRYGVSWASTSIAGAATMEEASAIAKAVADSGADNIADMRRVAQEFQAGRATEQAAQPTKQAREEEAQPDDSKADPFANTADEVSSAPSRAQSGPVSEPAAQESAPVEPNLEAARALLDEQKRATGNPKAEAAVRKKARDLAARTPISDEKTVLALDLIATRLGMGENGKKALDFAPAAKPEPAPAAQAEKSNADDNLADINQLRRKSIEKIAAALKKRGWNDGDGLTWSMEKAYSDVAAGGFHDIRRRSVTIGLSRNGQFIEASFGFDKIASEMVPEGGAESVFDKIAERLDSAAEAAIDDEERFMGGARATKPKSSAEQTEPKQEKAKPQVSKNTIFTDEAAEKARAILRAKLNQLNSGIDPEVMQAGITLAGYHIERGARTFAAYAKAMIEDMGEAVRPYLKSWYLGAKFDPRTAGMEGLSTAAEVESFDVDSLDGEAAAETTQVPEGETDTVVTPSGREIEVRYKVVEADDLIPSNLDDGRVNPDYPQELQPRNRSKAASELQVNNIAAKMNPRLLGESASTTDGAPIVSPEGVVESGNGRTMAILRAYRRGLDSAQAYRDWLASQGYDVAGMRQPVLVRERVTPMSREELIEYTRESNARTTMQMSPEEQAKADGEQIGSIIDLYAGGDIANAANRPFVRAFIDQIVPQSEQGDMVTDGGALSIRGRKRIEAALMHAAYGDTRLVADLFVEPSTEIKTIGGAMLDSAASWLRMRNNADPSLDVTQQLVDAVNIVRRAREEGKTVYDVATQMDVFSGATDPVTMDFLGMFFRGDRFTRQRSREVIADMLYGYATGAEQVQPGPDMFGMEPPGAQEILRSINEKRQREEAGGQQGDIFAGSPQADDGGAAGRRDSGQGPRAGAQDEAPQEGGGQVNVPGTEQDLERDRANAEAREPIVPATDGNVAGRDTENAEVAGDGAGQAEGAGRGDQRVPANRAATRRERGNKPVHRADGQFQPSGRAAGDTERAGSRSDSGARSAVEQQRETAVAEDAHAPGADDLNQRLAAQRKANKTPTKWGDKSSIDAALPLLLPEQREDVYKAEKRLDGNNGILFTNGTGTGKTATGLGIAKRFINDGKDNIIIVVPSDKIAADWVKFARMLGINLQQLEDTNSNGKSGPVVTTYANFGQNRSLVERDWDLVIADESHYLSSNENGDPTAALHQLRALTGHHAGFFGWVRQKYAKEYQEYSDAAEARAAANGNLDIAPEIYAKLEAAERKAEAKWRGILDRERAKWGARWEKQDGLPKTVFLSATPFAYTKNTDYAEGYLFHYVEPAQLKNERGIRGYNQGNPRDHFMMRHFGFRMRYNKLTAPDAGVNSQIMEQQFNDWLKKTGALSGRRLEVPFDYDRKFVLVDDAVGTKIDKALKYLREAEDGRYRFIYDTVMAQFDYQRRMYLLEAMKARAAVPIIREHMAAGRKVVVFHDFNKGGGFDPFAEALDDVLFPDKRALAKQVLSQPMFQIDFSGLNSPIGTMRAAFPDALFFNGTIPKSQRRANADLFNDDESGRNLIVVQSDAGREGVSLHDTTGKHQRVLINLGMPVKPVAATQIEGRIYRTGQASNAIFRYLTTGTAWEAGTFASKIAERASTAENLALGSEARGLKESFIDAYVNAGDYPVSQEDGRGGKDADRSLSAALTASPFERAKTFYWAQQKNTKRRDQREGIDYFATPEPVGFKMVEWANIRPNEKVLEPSAGHGAIARFFPEQSDVTMVEPSYELSQRAGLANGNARIVNDTFESLHINNKYDAIVMNPPYGVGGKTAIVHLAKAAKHLREGGRIVALIPRGGMADRRLEQFLGSEDAKGLHTVAKIDMPSATFERAGTSVNTQIVVLEKHNNPENAAAIQQRNIDLSDAPSVNVLFDRLENLSLPERVAPADPEQLHEIVEHITAKGKKLRGIIRTDLTADQAKAIDPYTFRKKNGAGETGWFIRAKYLDDLPESTRAADLQSRSSRARYSVDPEGRMVAEFGPVYDEFKDDPAAAIRHLIQAKDGEAVAAVTREGLGDISLIYGDKDKGLAHILDRHGQEMLDRLPDLLANGVMYSKLGQKDRVYIGTPDAEATIRLDWDGKARTWLVTAFERYDEKKAPYRNLFTKEGRGASVTTHFGGVTQAGRIPQPDRSGETLTNSPANVKAMSANDLRRILESGDHGRIISALIDSGRVVLHDTVSSLPIKNPPTGVQGLTMPDGTIRLVAESLNERTATAVLLHEAFQSGGEALLGTQAWKKLMGRLGSLYRQGKQSSGRAREFFDAARARVAVARRIGVIKSDDLAVEEFGAYTIEHYEQAPAAFRKWVDDLIGAIKAWLLRRFGIQAGQVTPAQLRALAVAALREQAAQAAGGNRFSVADADAIEVDGVERSTRNSEGRPIATTEEGIRNFWRWFGDSRAVDFVNADTGAPIVSSKEPARAVPKIMYHTTLADFEAFEVGRSTVNSGTFGSWETERHAIFVTPDINSSQAYGTRGGVFADGANVMPLYIKAENPLDLTEGVSEEAFSKLEQAGMSPRYILNTLGHWEMFDDDEGRDVVEMIKAAGYDSVIFNDENPDTGESFESWAVFRPEQIKSAIGNVGAFDPANPDIRYSVKPSQHFKDLTDEQKRFLDKIGPERLPQRLSDRWRQLTDNLGLRIRQAGVDRYAALLRNDEALYGADTLEGSIASSAWVLARMSSSAGGALSAMLNHGRIYLDPKEKVIDIREGTKGLRDVFQQLGTPQEIDRFMAWIAANRARKLMDEGRENLFTKDEIEAGINLSAGRMADGRNRGMTYAKAWKEFQQYRDDVLRIAEQSGTISKEQRELWSEEFYVPFYRVLDDDTIGGPSMSSGLSRQQAYKRLKGGKQNLNDLLENTLLNFHHLIQSALKNQAARQAIENAVALGIAEPTTESDRNKKASTFVMVDGQKSWYDVNDPLTFKALSAISSTGLNNPIMRVGRAFKRVFTNLTTVTPQFVIANLLRDSLSAMATSPTSPVPFANAVNGALVYGNEQNRARMIASGASFSFGHVYGQSADEIKAGLKGTLRKGRVITDPGIIPGVLMNAWRKWNNATDFAENVNRAGIWERNLEKGKLKASFEARDLMDFSAHGDSIIIRILTDLVPFLNARIQGLDKLYRSGIKTGSRALTGKGTAADRKDFGRFMAVVGALSVLSMMLYMRNKDDEEYRKLEDWQRDTYWFLRFGDDAFFIPKPFEVGAIATLAERALEQFADATVAGEKFVERLWHVLTDTFALDLPQIIKPVYELSANRNTFTGRPIEDISVQRLSPSLRVKPGTSSLAEGTSRAMEAVIGDAALSPLQIDHLIGAYLGQVGAGTVALADTFWRRAHGEQLPARRWHEYQPIKRFYRDLGAPAPYTRYSTDFYNALKEADKAYANVQKLIDLQEFDRADALAKKEEDKLAMRKMLNRAQRMLAEINAEMRRIQMDKTMSGEEKRIQLDRLREERNLLTEQIGKDLEQERVRKREQAGSR